MKRIQLDQFKSYRSLSEVKWSPNGSFAAFVNNSVNDSNEYCSNIYLYESSTGEIRRLTGMGKEKSFIWQDNETLLFPGVRSEKYKKQMENDPNLTVYYRISVHGGEAEEAFTIPLKAKELLFAADGKIVVSANYEGSKTYLYEQSGKEREAAARKAKEQKDVQIVDEVPWWVNGAGFTNKRRTRIYIFNPETKTVAPVTEPQFQVLGLRLSPCGKYVMYFGFQFEYVQTRKITLHLYAIATGKNRTLVPPDYSISQADFLDENTIVFTGIDQKQARVFINPWFYTVDIPSGKLSILHEYDCNVSNIILGDTRLGAGIKFKAYGGSAYFTSVVKSDCHLMKIDADGEVTHVIAEEGGVDCFDIGPKGIIFIGMLGQRLQELYTFDQENNSVTRVTSFNEWIYTDYYVAKPQPLSFIEEAGFTVDGWVLLPYEYDPQKKYPAILYIHGGPKGAFGTVFFNDMQYLANQGYFVMLCNIRGSEGKGKDFAKIRGNYGTYDFDNLIQFVDLCVEKYPAIDSGRLGVTGGSYGGFMVNWIIGHTDRFKAAVSERSISNWFSFIGLSSLGVNSENSLDAKIGVNPEKIWRQSPLCYAHNAKTPTLFLHSDQDYICCIPEGYQMFSALRRAGIEARMCVFHGETHDLSRQGKIVHRIRRLEELTKWFDEKLK